MLPNNEWNNKRQIVQKHQAQMKENHFVWKDINFRAKHILKHHNKTEFEKKYDVIIANTLEKMLYSDVGEILSGIAESVKDIDSDASVDYSRNIATRLMAEAMWATTSSFEYIFARRRNYPPDEIQPRFIQFSYSTAKDLTENLNEITAEMTTQDTAIFLGRLSAIYIKICPKELIRNWMERRNMNPNTLLTVWTLEGELLMDIYH